MSSAETIVDDFDEIQEIIDDFMVEAEELVGSLDTNLVKLEETPDDLDLLNEIFRAAHTIKGTSGFLALDSITSLTHKMEDVLNRLRKGTLAVNSDIMDILLESVDSLKVLLEDVAREDKANPDYSNLENRLAAIAEGKRNSKGKEILPRDEKVGGEKCSKSAHREKETIRVAVNRLDSLMNLMGELVLGRNSLVRTTTEFSRKYEDMDGVEELNKAGAQINFITTEIQLAVMKMRMIPVSKVFSRFPRMVRDIARETGKDINLDILGEETELDKSVIEAIGDPLVHLIRNSCDHGIELPEERKAVGKSPTGTIRLRASQEGSHIIIAIEDDGKGLDVAAIKEKAIEQGLVSEEEANRLSLKETFRFIFQAGFSTAKTVTDISGRGVGMDVVRANIEKLKGVIDLESTPGQGTVVRIKLPLTLAILQGLLVVSQSETYVIPLASVLETLQISPKDIYSINGHDVIKLRDCVLPIANLNRLLKGDDTNTYDNPKPYVVVVGLADQRLGLIVDNLLGQEEVVIKSMGNMLGGTKGLAGATILGDGRVRLIIDLNDIFEMASGKIAFSELEVHEHKR